MNVYTRESVMNSLTKHPKPLKSVGNLTTAIDQLVFHPNCQMLYMGSSLQPAAARLVSPPFFPLLLSQDWRNVVEKFTVKARLWKAEG